MYALEVKRASNKNIKMAKSEILGGGLFIMPMVYLCKKCGKEISTDITKVFIADGGHSLCSNCSVGVKPCPEELRDLIVADHLSVHEYDINYVYVFSDFLEIGLVGSVGDKDYKVAGFQERQSFLIIGAMTKRFKHKYAHQFKCKETLYLTTNVKDGNLNMEIDFKEATRNCDYISFIGG